MWYRFYLPGHGGVWETEDQFLGECEADPPDEAMHKFVNNNDKHEFVRINDWYCIKGKEHFGRIEVRKI